MTRAAGLIAAVKTRLHDDPEHVGPVLAIIADPDAVSRELDRAVLDAARMVNSARLSSRVKQFCERALTTPEVSALLGGISRQAVSLRVTGGQLMATEIAGRLRFPAWQFDGEGVVPGLRRVLAQLQADGRTTLTADGLMTRPLHEEGGASIAELLAAGRVDDALHYLRAAPGARP